MPRLAVTEACARLARYHSVDYATVEDICRAHDPGPIDRVPPNLGLALP